MEDTQYKCTVCGQIGTVGRCCGDETRIPMNDLARKELQASVSQHSYDKERLKEQLAERDIQINNLLVKINELKSKE